MTTLIQTQQDDLEAKQKFADDMRRMAAYGMSAQEVDLYTELRLE